MPIYILDNQEFEKYKNRTDMGIRNKALTEEILNTTGSELISDELVIKRFYEIRCIHHKNVLIKPINEYSGQEIVTCIKERVLLEYILPIISRYLQVCPLTAGAFYKGEVLADILELDKEFWISHSDWYLFFKKLANDSFETHGRRKLEDELEKHIFKIFEKISIED